MKPSSSMSRRALAAVMVLLVPWNSLAQSLSIENANYELTFNKTDILALHFDSSFYKALFLVNTTNEAYVIILDFEVLKESKHSLSLHSKFLFIGLLNTGNILLACEKEVAMMSKDDGYSLYNLSEPTAFVRKNSVTSQSSFNDFNQTALVVYNSNKLGEIDVRLPQISMVNEIKLDSLRPNYSIRDMTYISSGKRVAVLVSENEFESIHIFDQKTKAFIRKLGSEVDDSIRLTYNVEMNLLIMIKTSSKTLIFYSCETWMLQGSIPFSLLGLDHNKIIGMHAPLGTKTVLITTDIEAFLFDLEKKELIGKVAFPSLSREVHWAESTSWFVTKQDSELKPNSFTYKLFKLKPSDARMCHKSCGSVCQEPFKPCYNQWKIFFSMIIGLGLSALLAVSISFAFKFFISRSKETEITDEEGNLYELTETGNIKPKRNTISLEDSQLKNIEERTASNDLT